MAAVGYLTLKEAAEMMLGHYLDCSRRQYARFDDAHHQDETEEEFQTRVRDAQDQALLSPLADGLSLEYRPERHAETPQDDLASMVLCQQDIPELTAGSLVFRFAGGIAADRSSEAAAAAASRGGAAVTPVPVIDRHRAFCNPVCELSTDFTARGDEDEPLDFPLFVRDTKIIFSRPEGAKEYFRRAWRFLSENRVSLPPTAVPSSRIYGPAAQPQREIRVGKKQAERRSRTQSKGENTTRKTI